jgi:hypothetical protein
MADGPGHLLDIPESGYGSRHLDAAGLAQERLTAAVDPEFGSKNRRGIEEAGIALGLFVLIYRMGENDPQLPDDVCKLYGGFLIRNPPVEF